MGSCASQNDVQSLSPTPLITLDPDVQIKVSQLFQKFSVCQVIDSMLNKVAYTSEQAASIADAIITAAINIQQQESQQEKKIIENLFDKESMKLIRNGTLFYHEIQQKAKNILKKTKLQQHTCSRIYHMIANIHKEIQINQEYINEVQIKSLKNNDYKILTKDELQQLVKYEGIGKKIIKLGEQLNFRYTSIKQQSQSMSNFLLLCFPKYIKQIKSFQYNFSNEEIMKIAKISRDACSYYENGAFLLLVYLVNSCENLQKQSKTTREIEQKINQAIYLISEEYPPGKGLTDEEQDSKAALRDIQKEKKYTKVQFSHQVINLKPQNKQKQVEQIITNYAKVAQSNKTLFQELVKATCLKRCISFKIGLKYYPSNPNIKALTRIKQKMFFEKEEISKKQMNGSIADVLNKQQIDYLRKVDELLEKRESVQFKISDMVRGKCIFLEIGDIIQTVNSIKRFVKQDDRYGIAEIQSRFTNKIPISDVTLKIVLNKQIVAELQLTIQTNAAAYNFAHKIYELQRTKVFSKLKIVNNYFEEYKDDFRQLASMTLKVLKNSNNTLNGVSQIKNYFKLQSVRLLPFKSVLGIEVQKKKDKIKLSNCIDPKYQYLLLPLFQCQLGKWDKQIGQKINDVLQKQLSSKLKAALLSYFFQKFNLTKQANRMKQFVLNEEQKTKINYMHEYIKEFFGIQHVFDLIQESYRVYIKGKQLLQIEFIRTNESSPIELAQFRFIQDLVTGKNSEEKLQALKQITNLLLLSFIQTQKHSQYTQTYYNWLCAFIKDNNKLDKDGISLSEANLLIGKIKIEINKFQQALKDLQNAKEMFKLNQNSIKVLECQLLIAEANIRGNKKSLNEASVIYSKIQNQAKTLRLELKGRIIAESLLRISKYLWTKSFDDSSKKQVLKKYYGEALVESSKNLGKQYVYALYNIWNQFTNYEVEQPKLLSNTQIRYEKLERLSASGCKYLIYAQWKNLNSLDLSRSQISDEGCQYLIKPQWKFLSSLDLSYNNIQQQGCQFLKKSNWIYLSSLNLSFNKIKDEGCKYIVKAEWNNLLFLDLTSNKINNDGCKHLSKSEWKNLTSIKLGSNDFSEQGCQYLIKGEWKKLTRIDLSYSTFTVKMCEYLSKSDWKYLTHLNLCQADIDNQGCEHLCKGDWKKLINLDLSKKISTNNQEKPKIGPTGCKFLSKADWINLASLNLSGNKIGGTGCEYLKNADWKNLINLNLSHNKIGEAGCEYLSLAAWKNLSDLNLNCNNIQQDGCEYLMKNNWKNLKKLHLSDNQIKEEGCKHLAKADWAHLKQITLGIIINNLYGNYMRDKGFQFISKADWKNLKSINLTKNGLSNISGKYLAQSNWRKLEKIKIQDGNFFEEQGVNYFMEGKWDHLTSIE